jgi:hypothetical protein
MGTSNSNKGTRGKGTPLLPTWLDPVGGIGSGVNLAEPGDNIEGNNSASVLSTVAPQQTLLPLPPAGDADRFKLPRTNFSRFIRSGGNDRASLRRAISGYVTKTAGGARQAARGMGLSRVASAHILGFLTDVASRGAQEVLKSLNLGQLVGLPIEEIFLGISDYVCPEGGTLDAGIAREAFIQTIADLSFNGVVDINGLNVDQIQTVFELYATHAIETRLYNEIGNKTIMLSASAAEAEVIQRQLRDFIKNSVADALTALRLQLENLTPDRILPFVNSVYEQAFTLLSALGSPEKK